MIETSVEIKKLKEIIKKQVFVTNKGQQIFDYANPDAWIFDFRRIFLNGEAANLIGKIFFSLFKDRYPFQLGTLEIGGVPLVTTLMNTLYEKGNTDVSAFFVRKSRKKTGLLQMIEGSVNPDQKIILVDDTMNSGDSFWRQIEVLEDLGFRVDTVWSIIRYRDMEYYTRFHNRGIKVESLFTLDDFTTELGSRVRNLPKKGAEPPKMPFQTKWTFKSSNPSLGYVVPKSQPIIDEDTIYVGSDNETFWAVHQIDGTVKWSFKVGPHTKKKSIFSSPMFYKNLVVFGSYDGNVYALNKETGKRVWVSFEADWVGSSPAVAQDLSLVFIGLEFGLFRRHGGIVALNANTGETVWTDYSHSALTHASPKYIEQYEQVAIGSNEGIVRLYDARTGKLYWKFTTFGGAEFDYAADNGFGNGEIKQSIAYDGEHDYLIFGATDGFLYILNRENGHLIHHHKCHFAIWGTPCVHDGKVFFTSLDKRVRCIDLGTLELLFEKEVDGTRIFANPTIIDGRLYIGTNGARLHEIDPETGASLGYFQAIERITNAVVKNEKTGRYFLPTYANEIVCLERTQSEESGF